MPTCDHGYISKRVEQLMNGSNILDIAASVHQRITGGLDFLTHKTFLEYGEVLQFYADNWVHSNSLYDSGVLTVILAALNEFKTVVALDEPKS